MVVVEPATRSLHTAELDAEGIGGHMLSLSQVLWSIEHLPGVYTGPQETSSETPGTKLCTHAEWSMLQVPPWRGHSNVPPVQEPPVTEQVAPATGQPASVMHAVPTLMLQ